MDAGHGRRRPGETDTGMSNSNRRFSEVQVGVLTMLVAAPLGTMAAYALFVSGHWITRALFMFLIAPMIVPLQFPLIP